MRTLLSICLGIASLACCACAKSGSSSADGGRSASIAAYGDAADSVSPGQRSFGFPPTKTSPDLRQRAESLAALDPVEQARIAAQHGDLRSLAVCWKTCTPIGIAADTLCMLDGCTSMRRADVHRIAGMEVPVMNADVARLDTVGSKYGTRYNRVIREYRKRHPISRPVT